ncbi:SRPBCC domain-containing protein, partial [Mesorhizobium sp. M7A.F.Ca.MR.362.00.0.0]
CTDENQGDFFGQESWGLAVYKKMVAPEVILYTDAFSDKDGNVAPDMPEMQISVFFKEESQQTLLEIKSAFASEEALMQVLEM